MRLFGWLLTAVMICGLYVPEAQAENWFSSFCKSFPRDWKRNNAWPEPFYWKDEDASKAPFAIMIANGWRKQNTLGPEHFDRKTGQLNDAGRLRVEWIATRAPEQHRVIFVQMSGSPEVTQQRMDVVRMVSTEVAPLRPTEVLETEHSPSSWPADYIDSIYRKSYETIPQPRLPAPVTPEG